MGDWGYELLESTLSKIAVLDLRFVITFKEHFETRNFSGPAFRGALGRALKKVGCRSGGGCRQCLFPDHCLYQRLFDTTAPLEIGSNRGSPDVPRPFILIPPNYGRPIPAKQHCKLGLRLLGPATEYLAYFIYAVEKAGQQGIGASRTHYTVSKAQVNMGEKSWQDFYYPSSDHPGKFIFEPRALKLSYWALKGTADMIQFQIDTPMRLKHRGVLVKDTPEFHVLIRSLLRRLSMISHLYGGGSLPVDIQDIVNKAHKIKHLEANLIWQDWRRRSNRQRRYIRQGGLLGFITYEGPLSHFLPFLGIGRAIHIGKATTFGLGSYSLRFDNSLLS